MSIFSKSLVIAQLHLESTFAQLSSSTPQSILYRPRQVLPSDFRSSIKISRPNHCQHNLPEDNAFEVIPFPPKPVLQAPRVLIVVPLYCFTLASNHIACLRMVIVAHSDPLLIVYPE